MLVLIYGIVERALEKERELRMRDTVQIEQIIAQKLQQQETRLREKYDQVIYTTD